MARFFKVAKNDFVAVNRITNFVIHKYIKTEQESGDQAEIFAVCCFVDYGYGKEVEKNALYILKEFNALIDAQRYLIHALDVCGGAVDIDGPVTLSNYIKSNMLKGVRKGVSDLSQVEAQ